MISTDQARELFAQANPVPDEDSIDVHPDLLTAGLRITEPTLDESILGGTAPGPDRRRFALAAAAIIIAFVGVISLAMWQGRESSPITTPTTIAPVTTTLPSTPPTLTESNWDELPFCCLGGAGRYRTIGFTPEFSAEVPGRWTDDEDDVPSYFRLFPQGSGTEGQVGVHFLQLENTTAQQQADRLTDPASFDATEPQPVTVGGAEALRFETTPQDVFTVTAFGEQLGNFAMFGQIQHTVYVVDVNGTTLLILAEQGPGKTVIDSIVESIRWRETTP